MAARWERGRGREGVHDFLVMVVVVVVVVVVVPMWGEMWVRYSKMC